MEMTSASLLAPLTFILSPVAGGEGRVRGRGLKFGVYKPQKYSIPLYEIRGRQYLPVTSISIS
jgi:hypothetical protein